MKEPVRFDVAMQLTKRGPNVKSLSFAIATSATLLAGMASATSYNYIATLTGDQEPTPVATSATGTAEVSVDTVAETLSVSLNVTGISLLDLFDPLVVSPVGPVHLHNAPAGVNGPIAVAFPFWPTIYTDTADGFSLNVTDLAYSDAAALSGTSLSFDDFMAELNNQSIYFNVHTDFAPGGEIRGVVSPVPLPAGSLFMVTALGGFAAYRMRKSSRSSAKNA